MINSEKLINALITLNATVIYKADGTHKKFTGELPDDDLWGYHPNCFISKKNTDKWISTIDRIPMTVTEPELPVDEQPSLESVISDRSIDLSMMTKAQIETYARTAYGVELDRRMTKVNMIAEIKDIK